MGVSRMSKLQGNGGPEPKGLAASRGSKTRQSREMKRGRRKKEKRREEELGYYLYPKKWGPWGSRIN